MDLWDDDRAQSVQVGAVLLFAVLVILLAGYQSTVVPNDNRSAEFDHSLETEQDMLEVRNAIMEAYQDGEAAPVSVKLGTTYPRHTFAVNPAPVSGTLRTSDAGEITVTKDGSPETVCPISPETKFLNYSPGYNYYSPAPTLVYENTVLYADYGEDRRVILSDQSLVSGNTVNLVALQGEYSENGIGATDFQARAGGITTTERGAYNVTLPSRLPSETWHRILLESGHNVTVTDAGDGRVEMAFTSKQIRCSAVGADGTPPGGERPDGEGVGDGGDGGAEINPSGDVVYVNATVQDKTNVDATFENMGNASVSATEARLNFYLQSDKNKEPPTSVTLIGEDGTELTTLSVGGESKEFDQSVEFTPNDPYTIRFEFDFAEGNNAEPKMENDFFVVKIYFDDGTSNVYFISPTKN